MYPLLDLKITVHHLKTKLSIKSADCFNHDQSRLAAFVRTSVLIRRDSLWSNYPAFIRISNKGSHFTMEQEGESERVREKRFGPVPPEKDSMIIISSSVP